MEDDRTPSGNSDEIEETRVADLIVTTASIKQKVALTIVIKDNKFKFIRGIF